MTYHKEYTLHNGKKIYAEYNEYNICQVTKECLEMLLDLYRQGRADAIDEAKDENLTIKPNTNNEEKLDFEDLHQFVYIWLSYFNELIPKIYESNSLNYSNRKEIKVEVG